MKKTLLILSLWSFIGMAQFTEQNPIDAGSEKHAVSVADFDGDGLNDFVYANTGGIQWRSNLDGEETFHNIHQAYSRPVENTAEWIISLAAEDIDGDGDIDIAFATQGFDGDGVAWVSNLGDGEFSAVTALVEDVSMRRIYFEDLDADGNPDLIANVINGSGDYNHQIIVLESLGGGLFNTPVIIDEFILNERKTNAGDVDGDGDLDLIIGIHDLDEIRWYENLGAWSFGPGTTIASGVEYVTEVHATDIDEDGDLDIAYSALLDNQIAWIENLGGGTFGATETIHICNRPSLFRMEDIDDDDDLDIVFVWHEDIVMSPDSYINVLEKTGPGTYATPISVGIPVDQMSSIFIGDIDTDGVNDILFAGQLSAQYSYVINEGALAFSDTKMITGKNMYAKETLHADFNGDGNIDILCYSYYYGNINWMANNGDGTFGVSQTIMSDMPGNIEIIIFDVDTDGDIDIIVSSSAESTISWLPNLGDGTFAALELIEAGPITTNKMVAIDLDDDGDNDFVRLGSSGDELISYYENLGGSFAPALDIPYTASWILDAEVGDLDADGDEDLVILSDLDVGRFLYYENTGGAFAAEVELAIYPCQDFVLADLNNNGNLDIFGVYGSEWTDNEAFWMENTGGLLFADETVFLTNYMIYNQVQANDLNNDGHMDILLGGYFFSDIEDPLFAENTGLISWLENTGDGVFESPNDISNTILGFQNISLADTDSDGDQEIFIVSSSDHEINWFKNPFASFQQVTGNLYFDENENGIREVDEPGLGGIQVESDPLGDFSYTYDNGNYILNFDDAEDGDYLVYPQDLDHWAVTSDPIVYTITVDDAFTGESDIDFGFYPTDDETEVVSSIIGGFPRCNSIVNCYLAYENIGGAIASGTIALELNENITFIDAAIVPDSVVDQTCYWSFEDLFYFDEQLLQLSVEMPSFEFIGDTLTSYSTITTYDDLGAELSVYEDSISQTIICAYDPNDKTVFPKGEGDFGNIPPATPYLEYTVRFQNTGTDTALNIVIKDQLNESLDWSSLELLGNSHPMSTYIDHLGEVAFTFNEIMLPDSNVNELASHGFVKYRINLLPELPLGTVITNTANIYFDLNPAIVTNTTINTLFEAEIDDSGILEEELTTVLVYPNPFSETTTVYFAESLGENLTIRIFDVIGNQIYQQSNISASTYEISSADLGKGIYILTVESDHSNQSIQTARLIVQ